MNSYEHFLKNSYKNYLRTLSKGKLIELAEKRKRERYDIERTLPHLVLNPQYDCSSDQRKIDHLTIEIEILHDVIDELN